MTDETATDEGQHDFPTAPWGATEIDVDDKEMYSGYYEAAVWDNIGDLVCCVTTQMAGDGTIEHAKDRARLIAAAPEMLKALRDAEQKLIRVVKRRIEEGRYTADLEQTEEAIHDAIDKATP